MGSFNWFITILLFMKAIVCLLDYLTAIIAFHWLLNESAEVLGHWTMIVFVIFLCVVNIIALMIETPKKPNIY